jgi:hypothetical protein
MAESGRKGYKSRLSLTIQKHGFASLTPLYGLESSKLLLSAFMRNTTRASASVIALEGVTKALQFV